MGDLVHRPPQDPQPRPSGRMVRSAPIGYDGGPVNYQTGSIAGVTAWERLAPSTRAWAEAAAGEPIRDPHTGVPTVYWSCCVYPTTGPAGGACPATYELVLFGRRGLAVSSGETPAYVDAPGGSTWHSTRYALAVDSSAMRSDHRVEAARPAPLPEPPSRLTSPPVARQAPALRPDVAAAFGNLPPETQRFLLEPFVSSSPMAEVRCEVDTRGGYYVETYCAYVFTKRRVAFAYAVRRVPYRSGLAGPALWNDSPEARALLSAPWTVSAWSAPTPGTALTLPSS